MTAPRSAFLNRSGVIAFTTQTHTPADVQGQNGPAATSKARGLNNPAQKTPALRSSALESAAQAAGHDGRGATAVADGVVAKIAGIAIQEIEGVHALGGGAARGGNGQPRGSQPVRTQPGRAARVHRPSRNQLRGVRVLV